jgi:uncharacterized repeat protein (TIGR01451 family)
MARRLAIVAILLANLSMLGLTPVAAATLTFVTPDTPNGWQTRLVTSNPATVLPTATFVNGPETPPAGSGSLKLTVGDNGDNAAEVRYSGAAGVLLSSITSLSYSTYVTSFGSGGQAPYIILNLDEDANGSVDDQLFFEPVYQNGTYATVQGVTVPDQCEDPACVVLGEWQTWDAHAGGWWSLDAGTFGPPLTTLAKYAADHPNARIVSPAPGGLGGLRIVTGFGTGAWPGFDGNVDKVTLGIGEDETTFDFEPGTNLAIGKSASAGTVGVGTQLTYTISVVNAGPGNASQVVVSDELPEGTSFVSCASSQGGVCGGTGNERTVTFATLQAGATATILITVEVDEDLLDGQQLANTATVTRYEPDSYGTDDSATATVTVSKPCISPFVDVQNTDEACAAIVALTEAGVINGYDTDPPRFGPEDNVQRAQVAAFIVRALGWEDLPTGPRDFTDIDELLSDLPTVVRILANACEDQQDDDTCVAQGYGDGRFGPNDPVSYAQVITFIARAFQLDEMYDWSPQPGEVIPYTNVPAVHLGDVRTYHHYAGTIPDAPSTGTGWNSPAPREWVARVLYQALLSTPAAP